MRDGTSILHWLEVEVVDKSSTKHEAPECSILHLYQVQEAVPWRNLVWIVEAPADEHPQYAHFEWYCKQEQKEYLQTEEDEGNNLRDHCPEWP